MQGSRPVVQWVSDSAVRSELIDEITAQPGETDEILSAVEASESAVYAALNDLERRGLLEQCESGWRVTGRGQIVADLLAQRSAVEELFGGETDYWQTHDVSVLPEPFRLRLGELAGYELITISRTDPQRVVRTMSKLIEEAEWAWILAPIYQTEYATALPDNDESRLVLARAVIEDALEAIEDPGAAEPEHTEIRIGEAPVGLTLTPEELLVSFPLLSGEYDTRTEMLVESERARQWGRDLFEHYWDRAMPVPNE